MKIGNLCAALFILAFLMGSKICAQNNAAQDDITHLNMKLVWSDEFDYAGLPDPFVWGYEVGYIRNREAQYYTNQRPENTRVGNGNLIIESRKEDYEGFQYTSGSINTLDKKAFEGDFRVEIRAKLPQGKGIWPAIWMMGVNRKTIGWPKCSELDIMEFVGHTPGVVWVTMHWADTTMKGDNQSKGDKLSLASLHDIFHIYALERQGKQISVFVDETCVLKFQVPERAYPGSFTGPLYLLLNTAVGGSWGGEIDNSIFPQQFIIDYVRAYKIVL